jgi:hypothetical protein
MSATPTAISSNSHKSCASYDKSGTADLTQTLSDRLYEISLLIANTLLQRKPASSRATAFAISSPSLPPSFLQHPFQEFDPLLIAFFDQHATSLLAS